MLLIYLSLLVTTETEFFKDRIENQIANLSSHNLVYSFGENEKAKKTAVTNL